MKMLLLLVTAAMFVHGHLSAQVQVRPQIEATRIESPPEIDGKLEEPAWAGAQRVGGFIQARPAMGNPATEETFVRVTYDAQAIYIGARMADTQADSIVGRLARRDQDVFSDWFSVSIDSQNDRRTAFTFAVNPRGVRRDLMVYDDSRRDDEWDAVWEAATSVDSEGWTAEIRIPLTQLRFDLEAEGAQEYVWGINFSRLLSRRDELSDWAPSPPDAAGVVSLYGELLGLHSLSPNRRFELKPYTVGRLTRAPGTGADPFYSTNDLFGSVGADLKYGITQDLTLTATVNPDFGQVEADPAEVNLTAFESYLSEKRPFFTEGANLFSSGFPQLFYSRRIGRAPQGRAPGTAEYADVPDATTILGAAKLTGRVSDVLSLGVLSAVTALEHAHFIVEGEQKAAPVEPLTHYGVARISRTFREGGSGMGVMLTTTNRRIPRLSTLDFLPSAAYSTSLDGHHRFGAGNYEVRGAVRGSGVFGSVEAISRLQRAPTRYYQRPDADHLRYNPVRTSLAGYAANVQVRRIGGGPWRWSLSSSARSPGFEINDLGFSPTSDEVQQHFMVGYQQHRAGRFLRSWMMNVGGFSEWTFEGERADAAIDAYSEFTLLNHWGGSLWYMRHFGGFSPRILRGGPAVVWPARHMGMIGFHSDPRRTLTLRGGLFWETEDETGSSEFRPHLTFALRPSDRMELSLRPSLSRNTNTWQWVTQADADGGKRHVLARLDRTTVSLTARLNHTFTPDLTFQFYVQPYISAGDYSRFRLVQDPRARTFEDRFRELTTVELTERSSDGRGHSYVLDLDGDGSADATFRDPDFNSKQLRSNAVLRWEYRPGSTLFVVWSQGRNEWLSSDGSFELDRDWQRLIGAPDTNVFVVKLSYWLGI